MQPILISVGIEVESDAATRGSAPSRVYDVFNEVHDASIETPVFVDSSGFTYSQETEFTNNRVVGSEFVSRVLNTEEDDLLAILKILTGYLSDVGEPPTSERSGTHVHICVPYSLDIIKKVLYLARYLETAFYYLGGLGYTFRGVTNDFTYCRPITKFGPSCVRGRNGTTQIFDLEDLLESKTLKDFWNRYGNIDIYNPPGKYFPARYNWITVFNMLNTGTVEFRVFNKSLNPFYIYSVIRLCQEFCRVCVENPMEKFTTLKENSIYDDHTKIEVLDTFSSFIENFNIQLKRSEVETLFLILKKTPEIHAERKYFYTHLRNFTFRGWGSSYRPPSIGGDIDSPSFLDIHTITGR